MAAITLAQAAKVIEALLAGKRQHSVRSYHGGLDRWRNFLGVETRAEAVVALLGNRRSAERLARGYTKSLADAGWADATVAARLTVLRSVHAAARAAKLLRWDFRVAGPQPKKYAAARQIDGTTHRRMLDATTGEGPRSLRDRAILSLAFHLALRREAIVELSFADLGPGLAHVQVKRWGSDARIARTLPPETRAALQAWLAVRPVIASSGEDSVFVGMRDGRRLVGVAVWKIVRRAARRIGLKLSPRDLRLSATVAGLTVSSGDVPGVGLFAEQSQRSLLTKLDDKRRMPDRAGAVARLVARRG